MFNPLLITSFSPWRACQPSNSSDDLIDQLQQRGALPPNVQLLRQVPVNYQLAPCQVIAKLVELRPAVVLCCGMAETRQQLSLELYGRNPSRRLRTQLNLTALSAGTQLTEISRCAGTYVCNHLYFKVLEHLQQTQSPTQALFVHVPLLTVVNQELIVADFSRIVRRLSLSQRSGPQSAAVA
jgi:pyroglutamyl-peptidase